jgi:hypothetical protein
MGEDRSLLHITIHQPIDLCFGAAQFPGDFLGSENFIHARVPPLSVLEKGAAFEKWMKTSKKFMILRIAQKQ